MKIALVKWLDAERTDDEVSPTSKIGVTRETVGWILRRDDDGLVVAMTRDGGDRFERGFMIPAAYVVSVRNLGP